MRGRGTFFAPMTLRSLMLGLGVVATAATCVAQSDAVAPEYDTSHVYVAPADVQAFTRAFLGLFGGASTKQVVATVTPTPSSTTSQLLQTPSGTVSLFGFTTPVPAPFGQERTGWLVKDLDAAVQNARNAGAEVVVAPFPDPIGRDAEVRFPGGVTTQLYWHTTPPNYVAFANFPENRVYVSPDRVDNFLKSFLAFTGGRVVDDSKDAGGAEIAKPGSHFRRIRVSSTYGKLRVLVTNGALPWPYGWETTGYGVKDLSGTLGKAPALGVKVLVPPTTANGQSAMVQFPAATSRRFTAPRSPEATETLRVAGSIRDRLPE